MEPVSTRNAIRRMALDLDFLSEEIALYIAGKSDPDALADLVLEADRRLHVFAQRIAAFSIEVGRNRAVEMAAAFVPEVPEIPSGAPAVLLAGLDELVSGPVVRVSLSTGETLWGRVLEVSDTLLRVDTGNGVRTLDPGLVVEVVVESAVPEADPPVEASPPGA
jgi:hypothetical protein